MAVRGWLQDHGFDIIRYPAGTALWPHLARMLGQAGTTVALDVGGYDGRFGRELRRIGYDGRIVSFEPERENFRSLHAASAGDASWEAVELALGSAKGEQPLNLHGENSLHSFHSISAYGTDLFGSQRGRELVEVERLDHIFADWVGANDRVFLKIDTQGWDDEVIAGATAVLDRIDVLQVELSVVQLYEGQQDYLTTLSSLRTLGFHPSGFFPVLKSEEGIVELDCLLRRRAS